MTYVSGYHNTFVRLLRSIPELFMLLWFKFLSYPLPQNKISDVAPYTAFALAQHNIAFQPFTLSAYEDTKHAADPNALKLQPVGITVISCPDISLADLIKVGQEYKNRTAPTGAILQRVGMNYTADGAFTIVGRHARVYAAATKIPQGVLVYEFENIILARLGYSVAQR